MGVEVDVAFTVALADLPAHLSQKVESQKVERRGRPRKDDPTRRKYAIAEVRRMLDYVPPDDRDLWLNVGIILGREFSKADEAWTLYNEWSDRWQGVRGRGHDERMREAFYERSQQPGDLSLGTIVFKAIEGGWAPASGEVPIGQFFYFAPGNNFIYRPTGASWSAESVDAACAQVNEGGTLWKASTWLKRYRLVTSMTLDPGITEQLSKGIDCREGALVEATGAALFNAYRQPTLALGDARMADPFVEHVRRVFPRDGDADMFLDYLAHRVQRPGEKPRFALLIAGEQGVGKDTAISMCYPALGHWNVANIDPSALEAGFNEFEAVVLIVISEAANTHEMSRWAFNERTKVLIAGLPDYVTINPKYGHKYSVRRHAGVLVTTNHMETGIYLPADDRRYDVIQSATKAEMGLTTVDERAAYFNRLWGWFNNEDGARHVAALLHQRDIRGFNPSTGQRITEAHRRIVAAGMTGDEPVSDALAALGEPALFRLDALFTALSATHPEMSQQDFARRAPHALERHGYVKLLNPAAVKDGRWSAKDSNGIRRQFNVYYRADKISAREAMEKVGDLASPF